MKLKNLEKHFVGGKIKISILILVFISCKPPKANEGYIINGSINGDVPEMIFLEFGNTLDSAVVINNNFKFTGKTTGSTEGYIRTHGISAFINDVIYIENEEISLKLNITKKQTPDPGIEYNEITIDTITGTKTALIRYDFQKFINQIENNPKRSKLLKDKIKEIINDNPSNPYSSYLISQYYNEFEPSEINGLLLKLNSNAIPVRRLENLKRKINPDHKLKLGSQIADFSLSDMDGQPISTKDLRGKMVLIDFWASWCHPCRVKHPKMKEIFNKYNTHNFEILGVSIDIDNESWKKAVDNDELPWLNVIENEGFNGPIASRYNILTIPTSYLINPDGEIIKINITLEELETFLANL